MGHRWDSKTQKLFIKNKNYQRNKKHNMFRVRLIGVVNKGGELAYPGL